MHENSNSLEVSTGSDNSIKEQRVECPFVINSNNSKLVLLTLLININT